MMSYRVMCKYNMICTYSSLHCSLSVKSWRFHIAPKSQPIQVDNFGHLRFPASQCKVHLGTVVEDLMRICWQSWHNKSAAPELNQHSIRIISIMSNEQQISNPDPKPAAQVGTSDTLKKAPNLV